MTDRPPLFRTVFGPGPTTPVSADELAVVIAMQPRPTPADRPWVLVNMVSSIDGAITIDGRAGPLGGPADMAMFRALRGVADAIVVGAGTARIEGYGPPKVSDAVKAARRERGQRPTPRLVLVTASARLDPSHKMFTEGDQPPLIYTHGEASVAHRDALAEVAEVVVIGTDDVDLTAMTHDLRDRGLTTVLSEGGPTLNAHMIRAGLIDEWCHAAAPLLVGGSAGRSVDGDVGEVRRLHLDRVFEADDLLFLRYLCSAE